MDRVIVTGGTGFIGSNLIKRLVLEGKQVYIIIRPSSNENLIADIKDKVNIWAYDGAIEKLIEFFYRVKPTVIFHLASFFSAEHKCEDVKSLIESNLLFGTQLLEAASKCYTKYFISAGTHWQNYNGEKYNPVNLYAATKEAFEVLARFYLETTNMRMLTVKLCDTYGPNDPRNKVISLFKHILKTGGSLDMSEGKQELGLVYIDDVIHGFLIAFNLIKSMKAHEQKSCMVAPHKIHTLKEVAEIFSQAAGKELNINWGKRRYRQREMMKVSRNELNLLKDVKTVDLYDGFKKMLEIEKWKA